MTFFFLLASALALVDERVASGQLTADCDVSPGVRDSDDEPPPLEEYVSDDEKSLAGSETDDDEDPPPLEESHPVGQHEPTLDDLQVAFDKALMAAIDFHLKREADQLAWEEDHPWRSTALKAIKWIPYGDHPWKLADDKFTYRREEPYLACVETLRVLDDHFGGHNTLNWLSEYQRKGGLSGECIEENRFLPRCHVWRSMLGDAVSDAEVRPEQHATS